jgi:hypothetical protein
MRKEMKIKQENYTQNYSIYIGILHLLIWGTMCLLFNWWGILLGFLANGIIDLGIIFICIIWQEKKQPFQGVIFQQHKSPIAH